jgi:hypothetical protein
MSSLTLNLKWRVRLDVDLVADGVVAVLHAATRPVEEGGMGLSALTEATQ